MKKLTSLLIVFLMLMSFVTPVAASSIVSELTVTDTSIVIKGCTGISGDNVSVTLLNEGVSINDLSNITSNEDFLSKIAYSTVLVADVQGNYELTMEVDSTEGTTLYVTNSIQNYIRVISQENDYSAADARINFADYRNGKILLKGIADKTDTELTVLILKEGCTIDNYLLDASCLYSSATGNSDEQGRYEIYIDNTLEDGKKYNAYVVRSSAIDGLYTNNTVVLQNPKQIYVSKTKTGENVFSSIETARN